MLISFFKTNPSLLLALVFLALGGLFLLHKADQQARDTVRKHHLEDIEQSLYFAHSLHSDYPPYGEDSWCGFLSDPENSLAKSQIETALRAQNEKYKNADKPFPTDPSLAGYFYWKRSPEVFQLAAQLEAEDTNDFSSEGCTSTDTIIFDYGLNSFLRPRTQNTRI